MTVLNPAVNAVDARRIAVIWLLLIGATILSAWLGIERVLSSRRAVSVMILMLAMIKVRFVIRFFMNVRNAPAVLQIACDIWVVLLGGAMTTIYWMGKL